ncbi:MAG TPA: di-heme-cytochrome C peroxidase, partial [Vampirovibrionales bacterium]
MTLLQHWRTFLLSALVVGAAAQPCKSQSNPEITYLDQGWSNDIRQQFYFTPQGSRIMPLRWFMALESADGSGMFASAGNLSRYGLIPSDQATNLNSGGLPIGFALDPNEGPEGQYVGLTCAACHTANLVVGKKTIRIDGAPSNFDFDLFYQDLAASARRTLRNPSAFKRFADRVLANARDNPEENRQASLISDPPAFESFPHGLVEPRVSSSSALKRLRLQFTEFESLIAGDAQIRKPVLASGFGRVDALTQIVNSLAAVDQKDPSNLRPVASPTSYPHLWLTPQLEFVQWNTIAASPIGRNGGEVLGVFGASTLTGDASNWFKSSLLPRELHALEGWVKLLNPPKWDESIFGTIDGTAASRGRDLFSKHCRSCHNSPPYNRTKPEDNLFKRTFITVSAVPYRAVGTDPVYIEAFGNRVV